MKVLKTEPATMAEAKKIMLNREKGSELSYEQKIATDHLKKFARLKPENAKKAWKELNNVLRMSPDTAAQILNILPGNADELRMIFAREKFSLKEEEIKKILEIVSRYK